MKLIPKAKPVRFRITSGNVEHNSLDTLQENFVWQDICPFFDGRLVKWLRRINESKVANQIASIENPENKKLKVCKILFKIDDSLTAEAIITEGVYDKRLDSLIKILIELQTIDQLIKYHHNYGNKTTVFIDELARRADSFKDIKSGRELFSMGRCLYDIDFYKEKGESCILEAAERGYSIEKDFAEKIINIDIEFLLNQPFVVNTIKESWNAKPVETFNGEKWLRGKIIGKKGRMVNEQLIYDFSDICLTLYNVSQLTCRHADLEEVLEKLLISDVADPLYNEKMFVAALKHNT